ncbi:MAG: ABC transporter ATP-binding protein, partial [Eubacteriaceae bacterium]|nr:ABC transporter ATP-binding protein [Eubacteriaceae bacterium]
MADKIITMRNGKAVQVKKNDNIVSVDDIEW